MLPDPNDIPLYSPVSSFSSSLPSSGAVWAFAFVSATLQFSPKQTEYQGLFSENGVKQKFSVSYNLLNQFEDLTSALISFQHSTSSKNAMNVIFWQICNFSFS